MIKRQILLLSVALVLFVGAVSAQTANTTVSVRKAVAQINRKLPKLIKKSIDVAGISSEGAKATVYSENGAVRKIAAQIFGEMGRSNVELFYENENLIFAFERQSFYDKTFGKVVQTLEKRFYFENGELKSLVDGKRLLTDKDQDFAAARERILTLSKDLLENAKQ